MATAGVHAELKSVGLGACEQLESSVIWSTIEGMARHHLQLKLDSQQTFRNLLISLLALEFLFVVLDIFINYLEFIPAQSIQRLFNMGREDALGAWFASVQTLFVGLAAWLVYLSARGRETSAKGWSVLSLFFTYLAFDDGSKIHERVGTAVKKMGETLAPGDFAFPSYTWHLVFGPIFGGMALFILIFLWKQARTSRAWLIAALGCYVAAVGLDFVEGVDGLYGILGSNVGLSERFMEHFGRVLEEFLELLGSTLFLLLFLREFFERAKSVQLDISGQP